MPNQRLLVVGGGGSRGAWGAGFVSFLKEKNNCTYDHVIGTSTGSLMAPLIVLNKFDELKKAYTNVTQRDIFNVNPFKENGDLKPLLAIWRLAIGKKTFGESHNLKKLIRKFIAPEDYNAIRSASKSFAVTALNYKDGSVAYASSEEVPSYEEMIHWIWASANEPLFMSFVSQPLKGGYYVDGGVRQNIPVIRALQVAKDKGIAEIDIVVNKPRDPLVEKNFEPRGILKNLKRLIECWETEVRNDNIIIAKLLADLGRTDVPDVRTMKLEVKPPPSIQLHFHFIPQTLYEQNLNELIFNPGSMTALWAEGEKGHEDEKMKMDLNVTHDEIENLRAKHPLMDANNFK